MSWEEVLQFWFTRASEWFAANPSFDDEVRRRFANAAQAALRGELDFWAENPRGRLALILLLDQVPRNIHRGSAQAFAGDAKARKLALEAGSARDWRPEERMFLFMPLQHSEDPAMQEKSVELFRELKDAIPDAYHYALEHRDVIARFGRFPHRNQPLGRKTTPEEAEYLKSS